jgi:hypothetical protein
LFGENITMAGGSLLAKFSTTNFQPVRETTVSRQPAGSHESRRGDRRGCKMRHLIETLMTF